MTNMVITQSHIDEFNQILAHEYSMIRLEMMVHSHSINLHGIMEWITLG
ncbi:UNVERIFIED_CONTAM: hypothetical protein ABIC26_002739 [Paenibacillus sp. PvR008]